MKKFLTAFAAGAVTFAFIFTNVAAGESVKLSANEIKDGTAIVIENGRTLVPLRTAAESVGAEVEWNPNLKEASCVKNGKTVKFTINGDSIDVIYNSSDTTEKIPVDVPAKIINGFTYVPIRALAECLDVKVEWDAETKTVLLYPLDENVSEKNEIIENIPDDGANENFYQEVKAKDGTVVLKTEIKPFIINSDGKGAETIQNTYKKEAQKEVKDFIELFGEDAESYYNTLEEEGNSDDMIAAGGLPWILSIENEVTYIDDEKVSVLKTSYQNTGGAHPITMLSGAVYDLETGRELTLKDIFGDDSEILKKAEDGFKQMIKAEPEAYFEDAADTLDISKADYYIDGDGFTFFYNRYEIAPYARGLVAYTVERER